MFVIFYKKYYNAADRPDLLKLEKQNTQPLEIDYAKLSGDR